MDGKQIVSLVGYNTFFLMSASIMGVGLFLLILGTRSGLAARNNSDRVPTLAYIATVLGGLLILIPIYPLALLRSTTDLVVSSEEEMVRFTQTMIGITQRGYSLYWDSLTQTPQAADPDATPTPLYTQDGTPYWELPTAVPIEPTTTPTPTVDIGVYAGETAVPTVTGVWPTLEATAAWPVLNPNEGPPTPTFDIVELATQNAAAVVTAAPTLDPEKWNPQTPVATPVR